MPDLGYAGVQAETPKARQSFMMTGRHTLNLSMAFGRGLARLQYCNSLPLPSADLLPRRHLKQDLSLAASVQSFRMIVHSTNTDPPGCGIEKCEISHKEEEVQAHKLERAWHLQALLSSPDLDLSPPSPKCHKVRRSFAPSPLLPFAATIREPECVPQSTGQPRLSA